MTYDLDFRYRRALAPEGLTCFATCLLALNDAVADAKRAGLDFSEDAAVRLFSRRLARMTASIPLDNPAEDAPLREQCTARIAALKHRPAIIPLLTMGIDHRPDELKAYRGEGRRTLRKLAAAMGFDAGAFTIHYDASNPSLAGDFVLEADGVHLRLSPERWGSRALTYRHPRWQGRGRTVRHAIARDFADITALGRRIARDLELSPSRADAALI